MKVERILVIGVSFLVIAAGCKTSGKVAGKKTAAAAPAAREDNSRNKRLAERDQIELDYLFFNANKEKILGNNDAAYALFLQCLKKDPNNDAVLYALAQISQSQKRMDEALEYAKSAVSLAPRNNWYRQLYGDLLQSNKKFNEAAEVFEGLVKNNPDEIEYYFQWASALFYANKTTDAIKVYDKIEDRIGLNPEISIKKETLYIKLGKIDKAAAELQKLIIAFPKETQYYGMLGELYQANGMSEKALDLYKKILEMDPDNAYVHLSLADYYRSIGNKDKSFQELKAVFSNKNADLDTKYKILSSYFNILESPDMRDQARQLAELLVQAHPNEAGAHVFYAEYLFQDRKYPEARAEYKRASEMDSKNFAVWQQLLRTELELKDYDKLISESEEAMSLFPGQPIIYYLNGIAKIQTKKYKEGIDILESGVKMIVDNAPLSADFYANIGDAWFKLKNTKASDKAFEKAIAIEPKNANTLNNYSYYLSLRGDSLGKAEKLSRISNEIEPNNSYYQDTYGWILYKLGKYDEAKTWIEKAMKNREGESAVILEHYGDILYKLGDREKAVEYWQKARDTGAGSDLLGKKLAEKKLYE